MSESPWEWRESRVLEQGPPPARTHTREGASSVLVIKV